MQVPPTVKAVLALLGLTAAAIALLLGTLGPALAAGPPYPSPIAGQYVYD
ncbi:MAG: hypothetical protein ACXWPV_06335 [Candidatus Limnocylindrales bacterium]